MTKQISRLSLAAILCGITKPTPVAFLSRTVPAVRVACPYKDGLTKEARVEGVIGFDYTKTIQMRQLEKGVAPDFKAQKPTWGVRVGGALIDHKGKHYMEVAVQKSHFPRYIYDGRDVPASEITPYMPDKTSKTQADAGLEKGEQVRVAKYSLENVHAVELDGTLYELVK